jgi:uncharacterized membrane protein YqjE
MEAFEANLDRLGLSSKRCARRLLSIGENRWELLTVEVREGLIQGGQAVLLALATAVLGLLGAMALTAAVVVQFWAVSPVGVLLVVSGLYGLGAFIAQQRLRRLLRNCQALSASLDQLRKDLACLEKVLG